MNFLIKEKNVLEEDSVGNDTREMYHFIKRKNGELMRVKEVQKRRWEYFNDLLNFRAIGKPSWVAQRGKECGSREVDGINEEQALKPLNQMKRGKFTGLDGSAVKFPKKKGKGEEGDNGKMA